MRAIVMAGVVGALLVVAPASAQVTRIYPDKIYIEQGAVAVSRHVRKRTVRHSRKRVVRHVIRQRATAVRVRRARSGILPVTRGGEVRTIETNRPLANQGQALQQQQQNQFEINQLRQGLGRQSVTGAPAVGVGSGRICPPGATGC